VTHVPAAANFVALRRVAGGSQARNPWFGFGDFRPVSLRQAQATFPAASCADSARLLAGLPPLPGARQELEEARVLERAGANDQLLGLGFTVATVRQAALRDFRVLHFATHALLPTDLVCQDEPAIVTSTAPTAPNASGALLTASLVAGLQLDADTVILSACNTGGPNGGTAGESLSGLARSFFYAGARSLLVTHWPVNDQITRILVVSTLQHYRDNAQAGLAAALSESQRTLIGQAKGDLALLAHPYYWAPLALIGESSPSGALAANRAPGGKLALARGKPATTVVAASVSATRLAGL
jgi:CHAT domain-containing protein